MLTINSFAFLATAATLFTVGFTAVPPGTPPDTVDALGRLVDADIHISMKCLLNMNEREPEKSHVTMIPALFSTIAHIALNSDESSSDKFMNFTGLKSTEEIERCFPIAFASVRDIIGIKTELNLAVFADDEYRFNNDFTDSYNQVMGGATKNIDMRNSVEGARIINEWVKCQLCKGEDIVTPDDVCDDPSALTYISTSKFEVSWGRNFLPRIGQMDFCCGNKISSVKAITGEGLIQYRQMDIILSEVIKIPIGGRWHMVLVLPNRNNNMKNVLEALAKPKIFKAILKLPKPRNMTVSFPIPQKLTKIDFKNCLQEANYLLDIFDPMLSPVEGLCNGKNDYVSSILHESYLDLTMCLKNTEPSGNCSGSDNYPHIQVNREFIYFLMCDFEAPIICGTHQ